MVNEAYLDAATMLDCWDKASFSGLWFPCIFTREYQSAQMDGFSPVLQVAGAKTSTGATIYDTRGNSLDVAFGQTVSEIHEFTDETFGPYSVVNVELTDTPGEVLLVLQ